MSTTLTWRKTGRDGGWWRSTERVRGTTLKAELSIWSVIHLHTKKVSQGNNTSHLYNNRGVITILHQSQEKSPSFRGAVTREYSSKRNLYLETFKKRLVADIIFPYRFINKPSAIKRDRPEICTNSMQELLWVKSDLIIQVVCYTKSTHMRVRKRFFSIEKATNDPWNWKLDYMSRFRSRILGQCIAFVLLCCSSEFLTPVASIKMFKEHFVLREVYKGRLEKTFRLCPLNYYYCGDNSTMRYFTCGGKQTFKYE